jgi:hypothetical protein
MQQPLFFSSSSSNGGGSGVANAASGCRQLLLAWLFSARNTKQFVDSFFKAAKVFYSSRKGNALNFQRPPPTFQQATAQINISTPR